MQTLTSVYSWGNIETIPAFHHKGKTKLTLFSFTCKHLPGENFCLDYLLNLHYSFPKQYLSQILNCCHLEKWGVWKSTFSIQWIVMGGLSEKILFIKSESWVWTRQRKQEHKIKIATLVINALPLSKSVDMLLKSWKIGNVIFVRLNHAWESTGSLKQFQNWVLNTSSTSHNFSFDFQEFSGRG